VWSRRSGVRVPSVTPPLNSGFALPSFLLIGAPANVSPPSIEFKHNGLASVVHDRGEWVRQQGHRFEYQWLRDGCLRRRARGERDEDGHPQRQALRASSPFPPSRNPVRAEH
jgi:hypothetical protein